MSFQTRTVMLALSLAGLAALSGCDKLPGAAKPPTEAAKPVASAPASPPAEAAQPPPPASSHPDFAGGRAYEANLLKTIGQPNARQGQTLTLLHNGKPGLVVTDDEEQFHLLTDVIQVPTASGVQTVYEVIYHLIGQVDEPVYTFYDERGAAIESYSGYGQWRGAVLAISDRLQTYDIADDSRVSAQLLDWSSKPHRRFEFKSRCQPQTWVSDTEIKGVCYRPTRQDGSEDVGEEDIDAVFTRVGANAWRLRELRAPKDKLMDFDNNPPTAYDETVKGVPYSGDQ